ncbi:MULTISPECIES: hypothetical protein [Chryseobacterium]|uniref:Uncharacterized protein n=2 Tax=Chryseobacterium gleum TaxID=250 RepID=A0A3S4NSU4_CHRGE|nr:MULTISPECIES: hypothetical protein [Chryseobacterium]EFK34127.1 hypothetical protein HMPREF0204_13196 [Chryseobacterium gleum ATCC 35910]QQY30009.1 hypothetical protein I6I60_14085 [Chryseobacterium gleum]TLX26360.1 hypothetical protein FE904_05705 [Chryseobacterium indologenes]VEE05720.1 Uncharacterised protein [Chryseobacterium gleum]
MSNGKINKQLFIDSSNKSDLSSFMKFREISLDQAIKILKDSGISVSKDEASEILEFLHALAKITIRDFLLDKD